MISFEEAVSHILKIVTALGSESVSLDRALGRVIAQDVTAPRDLPPKDNSAMDGYAYRAGDLADGAPLKVVTLKVIGHIPAGHPGELEIGEGEAAKIMTGAPVPVGADTVVPVEDTKATDGMVTIVNPPKLGANIRLTGEDVKKDELVIPASALIRPAEIGMLASMGRSFVQVSCMPKIAILSTGDEIVEIDQIQSADGDKIVNSNSHGLAAQVTQAGGAPVMLGIGRDDPDSLLAMLENISGADMVLTTGGVSMGDYDYVGEVLERWGARIVFWKVAMKPGKPVLFAVKGRTLIFGLPGNPVSAMVAFEQFVRPAIRKLTGSNRLFRPVFQAVLGEEAGTVKAKETRTEFVRCRIECDSTGYRVTSVKRRGSGMLSTLVEANALLILPAGCVKVEPGEVVAVQVYDYEFLEGQTPGW